jgi:hypothetical protein
MRFATEASMDDRYAFAQALARHAGALAHRYWRDRARLAIELKGPQDFVSRADRDVETRHRSRRDLDRRDRLLLVAGVASQRDQQHRLVAHSAPLQGMPS